MFVFLWQLNSLADPSVEALQRKLAARPRHIKFAQYVAHYINKAD